jgi:hypothetical protein
MSGDGGADATYMSGAEGAEGAEEGVTEGLRKMPERSISSRSPLILGAFCLALL